MSSVNVNYNVAMADGGGYVSSSNSASPASAAGNAADVSGPRDNSSISSFSGAGSDFDREGGLNTLYDKKAQAESQLSELKGQRDEAQSKIENRRQEIIEKRSSGEDAQAANDTFEALKKDCTQKQQDKSKAQQELTRLNQEGTANDKAINSNAQRIQQTSASLSSAQSQLASLTPPSPPSGDDEEAQSSYNAQLNSYNAKKQALDAEISRLQSELQNLKTEAQELQNKKVQIDREKGSKQLEVSQLEAGIRQLQSQISAQQQSRIDSDPKLQQDIDKDRSLQNLQSRFEQLEGKITAKEGGISQIENQIAAAESQNSGLQEARAEDAAQDFREASGKMGFDVADAEMTAQNIVAKDVYKKPYSELTDEEKLAIEAKVEGEVTLAAMETARKLLKEDPDNAAAQAVIERGAKNLDAQEQLALANLNDSLDNMPVGLQDGAFAAMEEARANAAEGTDPDTAAMEALAKYISENADEDELSDEELAALDGILNAAGSYIDARECTDEGLGIVDKAAESLAQSDLYAMKAQMAADLGVDPSELMVLSAGDGNDRIEVMSDLNGGIFVSMGGRAYQFTAEEAKYLIIDGGKGNDTINVAGDLQIDMHIFGGDGNDQIFGGAGNDLIYGGAGKDKLYGRDGNDVMYGGDGDDYFDGGRGDDWMMGGAGSDTMKGGDGNDVLAGGDGNDKLEGGAGNDTISGGEGDDVIDGGDGHDRISGDAGSDKIKGGRGNDYIDGGEGNDTLDGQGGDDFILGGAGNDKIDGQGGNDIISGGDGDDEINGGADDDFILGDAGNDTIHGGSGADTISGGIGYDNIYGDSGNDKISGGADDDFVDGGMGDDEIWGNAGNDWLQGGSGSDTIYGNAGRDSIYGETGTDYLYGGSEDEEINGGSIFVKDYIYKNADLPEDEFNLDDMDLEALIGMKEARGDNGGNGTAGAPTAADGASAFELGVNIDEALKAYGSKVGLTSEQVAHLSKWCTAASFSGGMLGIVAGVSDFMEGDILNGIGNTASGVSALTSETTCRVSNRLLQIYQGSKVLGRISDVTGVIGGAVTTFNGIVDSFHAFENNDGWSRVSGLAEIGAGGAAMYAGIYSLAVGAACPPALIVAAICMGIYLGVEHFNPNK